jgi:hypothetical protein
MKEGVSVRVVGNRVLRKIFEPKKQEVKMSGDNCITTCS